MAQMLPMVQIVPEMNFAYDPVSGLISSSLGSGIVLLSMDDVNEQVAKVELAADEMIASLDPYTSPVGSYPGREGSYVTAGLLTNVVYGFLLASFIYLLHCQSYKRWGYYRWLIKKLLQTAGRLLVGITL